MDTIITDHHEPPDVLPGAVGVVDAKREGSAYPFRDLAGCGVAYRFMEAFARGYTRIGTPPSLEGMLGMAALGSFADRVPLVGENRVIVARGMKEVLNKRFVPFTVLRSHIWVDDETTTTEVLSKLVPVVGASRSHEGGNLGCELLLSVESEDAEEVMSSLILEAEHKKDKARRAMDKVTEDLQGRDLESPKSLVAAVGYLPGKTVGYCASRLAERLNKPVILISERNGVGNGEARGPKGVDLVQALKAHQEYFTDFGGHKQAAGFSIEGSKIPEVVESLSAYFERTVDDSAIQRKILIDGPISREELSPPRLKFLLAVEPFGEENRRPVFLLESLRGDVLKEIDGTVRLDDTVLVGEALVLDGSLKPTENISLVVSPFVNGSVRSVEVLDWKLSR
jgi:single-stranded-DNA-specific exonuclease